MQGWTLLTQIMGAIFLRDSKALRVMEPAVMTHVELSLALLALLMTPGPTNTLMLLAGREGGVARVARLVPVELGAYLSVIVPIAVMASSLSGQFAALRPVVAIAAGLWVLYLAIRLWRPDRAMVGTMTVTARRLAVTTALNPKGIIMGAVLVPATGVTPASLGLVAGAIAAVALIWGGAGALLPRAGRAAPGVGLLRRAASIWLMGLSMLLLLGGVGNA